MDSRAGVRTAEKSPGHSEAAMAFSSPALPASAGAPVRIPPTPAGRMRQQLAGLDDRELLEIVHSEPLASVLRDAACELLVSRHRRLVWSCVQPYRCSPEPAEDLVQVGYVGLVKAINNFDPAFGGSLAAYAQPCISGEIKRHFRDKRWQIHVKRSEEHTSELQSLRHLVCRLLLEKKKQQTGKRLSWLAAAYRLSARLPSCDS